MSKLELDLLQNGLDSLKHSAEHFLEDSECGLKYSILHLAQSIELFLKERLSREHNLLVFAKPEMSNENAKTVTINDAIKRLAASGINLSTDAKLAIEELQKTRNKVQHYKVNLLKKDVEAEIGRNVKFILEFLRIELSILLEDHIPEKLYQALRKTVFTYEELDKLYKEELKKFCEIHQLQLETELCPDCGHFGIIYPDPRYPKNDIVKCFYCKEELEIFNCHECGITCFLKESIYHECTNSFFNYGSN